MTLPATYRTRGGLIVTLYGPLMDYCEAKIEIGYKGYFQIRDIRIIIYYDKDLLEVNGEKGLDLMTRLASSDMVTEAAKKSPSP